MNNLEQLRLNIIGNVIKDFLLKKSSNDSNIIYEEIFNHPNSKYVLDVPLLFESHINEICDKVILVDSNDDLLIKHLKKRNTMSIDDALKFKKLQKEKIDYSKIDIILNNDSTLDNLEKKINELIITFNK
jgi:dephospho-CoA kinase